MVQGEFDELTLSHTNQGMQCQDQKSTRHMTVSVHVWSKTRSLYLGYYILLLMEEVLNHRDENVLRPRAPNFALVLQKVHTPNCKIAKILYHPHAPPCNIEQRGGVRAMPLKHHT